MKILYDHQVFSWQKYGGISRYFYEIIKRISEKENVNLFQGYNINKYGLNNLDIYDDIFSKKRYLIPKTGRLYKFLNKVCLKNFSNKNRVDIYHPTYYNDYNLNNGKLIVTVYDMIHELFSANFKNDKTCELKRNLLLKADGIISISESTKKDLINILNIPSEKIKVIYLANSLNIEVKDNKLVDVPYILYVGQRKAYKNFNNFLIAYAKTKCKKDFKCVCFGGGPFIKEELFLINKLGLKNNIIYKSGNDNVLANLYKYAEAFIYPSKYEGFGLPPLEAMYYETPVLVSESSSIPEVVGDAGIYFNPNSIDDMAIKIDKTLSDKNLLKILKQKGKKREQLFSWDKCAKETIDFYYNII